MTRLALSLVTLALFAPASANASTCKFGTLPDHVCTPGIARTTDQAAVCPVARNLPISAVVKRKVFARYGIAKRSQSRYVVAPLIPFALAGSTKPGNLFPQSRANFAKLLKLGNALRSSVCRLDISLQQAQAIVAEDWSAAYRKFFSGQ